MKIFICVLLFPWGAAADCNLRGLMQRIFNTQAADWNLRRLAGGGGMEGGGMGTVPPTPGSPIASFTDTGAKVTAVPSLTPLPTSAPVASPTVSSSKITSVPLTPSPISTSAIQVALAGGMGGGVLGGGMGGTSQPVTLSPTNEGETRAPVVTPKPKKGKKTNAPVTLSPTNEGETRAPVVTPKPKKGKKTNAPVTLSPTNEGETRAPVVTRKPKKTKKPKITQAPSSFPSKDGDVNFSEAPSF